MSEIVDKDYSDIRNDLLRALAVCKERIDTSERNKEVYTSLKKEKAEVETLIRCTRDTANHMVRMYKNVESFLDKKKQASKEILETSIRSAGAIVESAELEESSLRVENGKAWIENRYGENINLIEGGGARTSISVLISYACIKALPNSMQIMFMDESFSALSSNSTINMKSILSILSKNIGIVGIEQTSLLYSGIESQIYNADKIDDETKIRKVLDSDGK